MLSGTFAPTSGSMKFLAAIQLSQALRRMRSSIAASATRSIPRPFHRLTIFENVALAGYTGQGESRAKA